MKFLNPLRSVILLGICVFGVVNCGKSNDSGNDSNVFVGQWYGKSDETLNVVIESVPAPYSDYNHSVKYVLKNTNGTEHCKKTDASHLVCAMTNTTLSYDETNQTVLLEGPVTGSTSFSKTKPQ